MSCENDHYMVGHLYLIEMRFRANLVLSWLVWKSWSLECSLGMARWVFVATRFAGVPLPCFSKLRTQISAECWSMELKIASMKTLTRNGFCAWVNLSILKFWFSQWGKSEEMARSDGVIFRPVPALSFPSRAHVCSQCRHLLMLTIQSCRGLYRVSFLFQT